MTCRKCGIMKSLTEFSKDRDNIDGLNYTCKSCCNEYYYANRLHIRQKQKKYCISNPDIILANGRNRRARERNAPGKNTASDIKQLMTLQKSKCAVCRCSIKNGYHVDHVIPLSKGGSNDKFNLQLLCQHCNQSKHAKDPVIFMQQRGFLL